MRKFYIAKFKNGHEVVTQNHGIGYMLWDVLEYVIDAETGEIIWDAEDGYLD